MRSGRLKGTDRREEGRQVESRSWTQCGLPPVKPCARVTHSGLDPKCNGRSMKDVRQLDSMVRSVFLTVTWADMELGDRQETMQQLEAANQMYTQ